MLGRRVTLGVAALALQGSTWLWSGTAHAAPRERPMTAPVTVARASPVNERWIELILPEIAYDPATVAQAERYRVGSGDDPAFATGVRPILVHHRHFPESAPYSASLGDTCQLVVAYRVYLQLPEASPLHDGRTYTVTIDEAVGVGGPYTLTFGGRTPNDAIHVNQVAYLPNGPKVAYLSAWTGDGTVDFGDGRPFRIVDDASDRVVFEGQLALTVTGDREPWSRSDVYALSFTAFEEPGRYRLVVPSVGSSRPFTIGADAYEVIGFTVLRGLTMQRDGRHGLDDPSVTQWTRPPAHLDDALVESSGARADLVGGHMDAGDRGKYFHNVADVSAVMLAGLQLFPRQAEALGESLRMPESGNGVPDVLDEALFELDFMARAVLGTPKDGTLPFYLRPQNANGQGGYEMGVPPAGKKDRKLYDASMGPNRSETLYAAGALAMAYNNPLVGKHAGERRATYLAAAERAFRGFMAHHGDAAFWKDAGWYDPWTAGPNPWSDEMLVAAAALYEATGDAVYLGWIQQNLPADLKATKRWGWTLGGPWLLAFLALHSVTRPGLEAAIPGIHAAARAAIVDWGDATMKVDNVGYAAPFGMPLPRQVQQRVGWYYSGEQTAFPLMVAYGVTGDAKYRTTLIKTWNYLLGTNPLSRTFISGLGDPQRSPRWQVHEIGHYQYLQHLANPQAGWSELPPGIPSADIQSGTFDAYLDDAYNVTRKTRIYPQLSSYPALYRYHDSWTVGNEFTIDRLARGAVSILPLVSEVDPPDPAIDAGLPAPIDAGLVDAAAPDAPFVWPPDASLPDAAGPPDTAIGPKPDATIVLDAASRPDTALPSDGAALADTPLLPDARLSPDARLAPDAVVVADAVVPHDAYLPLRPDAAPALDAALAHADAGTADAAEAIGPRGLRGGCDCAVGRTRPTSIAGALVLAAMAALVLRRRRHSRDRGPFCRSNSRR